VVAAVEVMVVVSVLRRLRVEVAVVDVFGVLGEGGDA
jgi:hypothetical protein